MTVELKQNLDVLSRELRHIGLWESQTPDTEKLLSQEPFCVDTLAFEQWLQWIFIPKLGDAISMEGFSGLANKSDIHSMADYVFKGYTEQTDAICEAIKNIDNALNALLQ